MYKKAYVCLKVGDKYPSSYVNKLSSMIRQWDPGYTNPLFCYTEDPHGLDSSIQIIPIKDVESYEKWWFKLPLLVEPTLSKYDKKILFDLDIIIHGPLNFIDTIDATRLTVCKAYWKNESVLEDNIELNTLYNSSVMVWKDARYVYDIFHEQEDLFMVKYKGVDRFLHHEKIPVDVLPPGIVYSYKKGADLQDNRTFTMRENYIIALFHQYPKQHNLQDHEIVKRYWI